MNNDLDWTATVDDLPPNGEVVLAMDSGGHVQTLKRCGQLWYTPDKKMYVYYTPTFWKKHERPHPK